jgi:superoxide dismutase
MDFEQAYRVAFKAFNDALDQKLNREGDVSEIAPKFHRGTVILQPEDSHLQSKEVDIDVFFKKIVSVRNNLRVLEQKINSNPKLDEADKIDLQGYITKSYGSLTTFNVLFRDNEDKFVGSKTD